MSTDPSLTTTTFLRPVAVIIAAVWVVALLLAATGVVSASTASGLAVGAPVGGSLAGLGLWTGLRRSVASADASRLDALEPLPPRER